MTRPLVLGLGNDLIADDGVGIHTARGLKSRLAHDADIIESSLSGLALLDLLIGYRRVVIIDAMFTGHQAPGTIVRLIPADLPRVIAPTPHFAGLPELFGLARRLDLDFPGETVIFAMEVEDPLTIGGSLSPAVRHSLPDLIDQVAAQVTQWIGEPAAPLLAS